MVLEHVDGSKGRKGYVLLLGDHRRDGLVQTNVPERHYVRVAVPHHDGAGWLEVEKVARSSPALLALVVGRPVEVDLVAHVDLGQV